MPALTDRILRYRCTGIGQRVPLSRELDGQRSCGLPSEQPMFAFEFSFGDRFDAGFMIGVCTS